METPLEPVTPPILKSKPKPRSRCTSSSLKDDLCGNCDVAAAVFWCLDCRGGLCVSCELAHRRVSLTRNHRLHNQLEGLETKHCVQHPSELLEMICITCKTFTCKDCQLTEHKNHSYQFVNQAMSNVKQHMLEAIRSIRAQAGTVDRSFRDMETRLTYIEKTKSHINNDLVNFLAIITKTLQTKMQKLYSEIQETCNLEKERVMGRMELLNQLQQKQAEIMKDCEESQSTNKFLKVMCSWKKIKQSLIMFQSQDLSPPPTMSHFLLCTQQNWPEIIDNMVFLETDWIPFAVPQGDAVKNIITEHSSSDTIVPASSSSSELPSTSCSGSTTSCSFTNAKQGSSMDSSLHISRSSRPTNVVTDPVPQSSSTTSITTIHAPNKSLPSVCSQKSSSTIQTRSLDPDSLDPTIKYLSNDTISYPETNLPPYSSSNSVSSFQMTLSPHFQSNSDLLSQPVPTTSSSGSSLSLTNPKATVSKKKKRSSQPVAPNQNVDPTQSSRDLLTSSKHIKTSAKPSPQVRCPLIAGLLEVSKDNQALMVPSHNVPHHKFVPAPNSTCAQAPQDPSQHLNQSINVNAGVPTHIVLQAPRISSPNVVQAPMISHPYLAQALMVASHNVVQAPMVASPNVVQALMVASHNVAQALKVASRNVVQALMVASPNVVQAPRVASPNVVQAPMVASPNVVQAPMVASSNVVQAPMVASSNVVQAPMVASPNVVQAPMVASPNVVQAPMVASSNVVQAPRVASSNVVQAPMVASSNVVQAPRVASHNVVQAPMVASSNVVQAPRVASHNVVQAPIGASSNVVQAPRAASSNVVQAPKVASSNVVQAPKVASSNVVQAPMVASPNVVQDPMVASPNVVQDPRVASPNVVQVPIGASFNVVQAPMVASSNVVQAPRVASPNVVQALQFSIPTSMQEVVVQTSNAVEANLASKPLTSIASLVKSLSPSLPSLRGSPPVPTVTQTELLPNSAALTFNVKASVVQNNAQTLCLSVVPTSLSDEPGEKTLNTLDPVSSGDQSVSCNVHQEDVTDNEPSTTVSEEPEPKPRECPTKVMSEPVTADNEPTSTVPGDPEQDENQPTTTTSEEHEQISSSSDIEAVDEPPRAEWAESGALIGHWKLQTKLSDPRVSLLRIPVSNDQPGFPHPRFCVVIGESNKPVLLEETKAFESPTTRPCPEFIDLTDSTDEMDQGCVITDANANSPVEDGLDLMEPLLLPESPFSLQVLSCSVCTSSESLIICSVCARGFHKHCHIPEVKSLSMTTWICSLCEDASDPLISEISTAPEDGLSIQDQRRCEILLLFLKVQTKSPMEQLSKRLILRDPSPYRDVAQFVSDVEKMFSDMSQDEASHGMKKCFLEKLNKLFGSEFDSLTRKKLRIMKRKLLKFLEHKQNAKQMKKD